jgi:hypothetical protein
MASLGLDCLRVDHTGSRKRPGCGWFENQLLLGSGLLEQLRQTSLSSTMSYQLFSLLFRMEYWCPFQTSFCDGLICKLLLRLQQQLFWRYLRRAWILDCFHLQGSMHSKSLDQSRSRSQCYRICCCNIQ